MSLVIPTYIPVNEISRESIQHEWRDWDPYKKTPLQDKYTMNSLSQVSNRAVTAISAF